jgi:hypothetical protein
VQVMQLAAPVMAYVLLLQQSVVHTVLTHMTVQTAKVSLLT